MLPEVPLASDDDDFHPVRGVVLSVPAEEFLSGPLRRITVECLRGAHVETGEGMLLVHLPWQGQVDAGRH